MNFDTVPVKHYVEWDKTKIVMSRTQCIKNTMLSFRKRAKGEVFINMYIDSSQTDIVYFQNNGL